MKINYRTHFFNNKISDLKNGIATIGVFDGVHLGHQKILTETIIWSDQKKTHSVAITFEPHPQSIIKGRIAPKFITTTEQKMHIFNQLGIDVVITIDFDKHVANMNPKTFIEEFLVKELNVQGVILGFNSRYGKDARGNYSLLEKEGQIYGFETKLSEPLSIGSTPISSSEIREQISQGNLNIVSKMLGRKLSILSKVIKGRGFGKQLGFPTANFSLKDKAHPPAGVYLALIEFDATRRESVVNFGVQPDIKKNSVEYHSTELTMEAHVLDFNDDLYGKFGEVILLDKLRDEISFSSREQLIEELASDIKKARKVFRSNCSGTRNIGVINLNCHCG